VAGRAHARAHTHTRGVPRNKFTLRAAPPTAVARVSAEATATTLATTGRYFHVAWSLLICVGVAGSAWYAAMAGSAFMVAKYALIAANFSS